MADFDTAYERTLRCEGGYANDPVDRGGETWRGISRVHFPHWPGWALIDRARRAKTFPRNLDSSRRLAECVSTFYREQFWDRIEGDLLSDQQIAEEVFDTAVNMGVRRAVRFLQEALNLLNRNQRSYRDLVVDGAIGPRTRGALDQLLLQEGEDQVLLRVLNLLQGSHYLAIMRSDPAQERFARGWLKRAG